MTLLASLAVAAPASAAPVREEVVAGQVTATLSYDRRPDDTFRDFRVTIVRGGQMLVDDQPAPACRREPCGLFPANRLGDEKSIAARDLDGDGEPEVIVDLFTGGAHCCLVSTIYAFNSTTGAYGRRVRDWADAGYRLRDIGRDGSLEFDSRDARFAYAFAPYAGSYLPVQIFRFTNGRLVDVTRRFRGLIRADARRALRLYRRYRGELPVGGVLAGFVADKYLLGERRSAQRTLRRAARRGDLPGSGRRYIGRLKRFLRRLGY